ncbi:MAG: nucleotidyltransferase family protein [Lawsonibacter sp.]
MQVVGIVAEYNPFHTGHAYQIARTRAELGEDAPVVAVMSGCWVQGGRCAAADKWTRSRLALTGGVDLVLELPTVWAVSSAETFARGAVASWRRSEWWTSSPSRRVRGGGPAPAGGCVPEQPGL